MSPLTGDGLWPHKRVHRAKTMDAGRFPEYAHQRVFDEGWKELVRVWGQTGSKALKLRSLGTFLRATLII
jgi:hypothetical protein